jgi:hypothetical protein
MIRMLIVGYCFGIRSERRLCEEVHLNLAYRWFCRLGLDGDVPDHSTFSKNRHGRFPRERPAASAVRDRAATLHRRGLVGGEGFAVDASLIAADASEKGTLPFTIVVLRAGKQSEGRLDRELTSDLEMLVPVGERPTDPSLESGLIVGNIATPREPGLVQPVDSACLERDVAAQDDFGHAHRREVEAADLTLRVDVVDHERDVVPTIREGDDLGLIPHVAQPLAVCEPALDRPSEESFAGGLRHTLAVGLKNAYIGDSTRGQIAKLYLEAVRILSRGQGRYARRSILTRQDAFQLLPPAVPEGLDVKDARGKAVVLFEAAREVGGGGKAAV